MIADAFFVDFWAKIGRVPSSQEAAALLEAASVAEYATRPAGAPLAWWTGGASGVPITAALMRAKHVASGAA